MGPATLSRPALHEASWSGTLRSAGYEWISKPSARTTTGSPPVRNTDHRAPLRKRLIRVELRGAQSASIAPGRHMRTRPGPDRVLSLRGWPQPSPASPASVGLRSRTSASCGGSLTWTRRSLAGCRCRGRRRSTAGPRARAGAVLAQGHISHPQGRSRPLGRWRQTAGSQRPLTHRARPAPVTEPHGRLAAILRFLCDPEHWLGWVLVLLPSSSCHQLQPWSRRCPSRNARLKT